MLLSWMFLKTRYRLVHFVAVAVCLLGVGTMVGADIVAGREQGSCEDLCFVFFLFWRVQIFLTWGKNRNMF